VAFGIQAGGGGGGEKETRLGLANGLRGRRRSYVYGASRFGVVARLQAGHISEWSPWVSASMAEVLFALVQRVHVHVQVLRLM